LTIESRLSIANHISKLLHDHKCVIVPDLGGFLVDIKPAHLDKSTQTYYPPSSKLAFNKNLVKSDGLLYNEIIQEQKVEYHIAERMVARFVSEAKQFLKFNKSYIIPKIGKVYLDNESNLQFIADTRINYRADSFGLQPIPAEILERKQTLQVKEKVLVLEQGNRVIHKIPVYAAAAMLALLICFGGLFLLSGSNSSANHVMTSIVSSVESAFTKSSIDSIHDNAVVSSAETKPIEYLSISPSIPKEAFVIPGKESILVATPVIEEPGKNYYHVVIGMFGEEKNAFKMEQTAIAKGYSPITKHGRKYHRVMLKFARQDHPQRSTLRAVKSNLEPGAWIWETRNR